MQPSPSSNGATPAASMPSQNFSLKIRATSLFTPSTPLAAPSSPTKPSPQPSSTPKTHHRPQLFPSHPRASSPRSHPPPRKPISPTRAPDLQPPAIRPRPHAHLTPGKPPNGVCHRAPQRRSSQTLRAFDPRLLPSLALIASSKKAPTKNTLIIGSCGKRKRSSSGSVPYSLGNTGWSNQITVSLLKKPPASSSRRFCLSPAAAMRKASRSSWKQSNSAIPKTGMPSWAF